MEMNNLELREHFEQVKSNILNKIQKNHEKWEKMWQEAVGNPRIEAELIYLKLKIQLMEAEANKELKALEEKVRGVE